MIDRTLFIAGWAAVTWFALQALPVTRLVYQPDTVEIVGDDLTLYRDFPADSWTNWRPRISYVEIVRPLTATHNGGQSCQKEGGPFRYTREFGNWSIDWAADCLDDPEGFMWSAYWYWHIGALRVGPTSLYQRTLRDPCQYRVSTTGIIHGPDSPHWSQTSTERCFPTRAAAEASLP